MGLALIIPNIDFSGANIGRVTPAEDVPLVSLSVSGPDSVTGGADTATYLPVYNPANTNQRSVVWSVQSGGAYATITTGGVLTILQGASASSVIIRVASTINSSIYADKTISVTYGSQELPEGAQPCDIVFSDGVSAFIESGLVPGQSMSYEAEIMWVCPSSGIQDAIASYISGKRYAPLRIEDKQMYVCYNYWYLLSSDVYSTIFYAREKVVLTPSGASAEIYDRAGNLLATYNKSYSESWTPTDTFALLGTKTDSTSISSGSFRGGLGRLKCYEDDHFGTLAADYIPCYYQGNFGFWDAIGEQMLIGNTPGNIGGFGGAWNTTGFIPHVINSSGKSGSDYLEDNRDYHSSAKYAVPGSCGSIRFKAASSTLGEQAQALMFFDANGDYLDWFAYNTADRVISVPSGAAFVRLSVTVADVDDCYIYDGTNGNYIWKGVNVN